MIGCMKLFERLLPMWNGWSSRLRYHPFRMARIGSRKFNECLKLLLWKIIWDIIPTRSRVAARIGSRCEEDLLCVLYEVNLNRLIICF